MSSVYANGNAIACKSGEGKVIAAFPDVCLSPPSPPAGPIPVPYPDSSFSRDTKEGSRSVTIGGKEVMLKDQSYFKSSPLGDEAATRSFGANIITHSITGKTYFAAYSMDVRTEGKNVCRHLDITTSNHASYPGGTGPMTEMEAMALAALEDANENLCPCCWQSDCPAALSKDIPSSAPTPPRREPYSYREWYRLDEEVSPGVPSPLAAARRAELAAHSCMAGGCPNSDNPERKSPPPCDVYRVLTADEADANASAPGAKGMRELRKFHKVPLSKDRLAQKTLSNSFATAADLKATGMSDHEMEEAIKIDHRTPRAAGGCPSATNNTVAHASLCANCKRADQLLDSWSSQELTTRRAALGV